MYFTGHSLGAIVATLNATFPPHPTAVYSFGAPKVGNRALHQTATAPVHRLVHGNDFAPCTPPALWGYHHPSPAIRIGGDEWRGLPSLAAHDVGRYVDALEPLRIGAADGLQ